MATYSLYLMTAMSPSPVTISFPLKTGSKKTRDAAREVVRNGGKAWNRWRKRHPSIRPDLSKLDLQKVDLSGADLTYSNLSGCKMQNAVLANALIADSDLTNADLSGADLSNAGLYESDLINSNLCKAQLNSARLFWSNLRGADLSYSDMRGVDLSGIDDMTGVIMTRAVVGWTIFGDLDLRDVEGLETVRHEAPSTIGIDTIFRSNGQIPKKFLVEAGVPEDFIEYVPSLLGKPIEFYSCFISHSTKDKQFCDRLVQDLKATPIRTWYFQENAKWGEPMWGEIDCAISHFDKVIVVCSRSSLTSNPVLREIERALRREDQLARNVLFPIRIDDFIFSGWEHPRRPDVIQKIIGDFRNWKRDPSQYKSSLAKLIEALHQNIIVP